MGRRCFLEVSQAEVAKKLAPWGDIIVRVGDGWLVFESLSDFNRWKSGIDAN